MEEPLFVDLASVYELHARSIDLFGGTHGTRDPGMIESALASAKNVYYYAQGDEFDVAAAYAFHLAEAQAFLDGNKRIGLATAIYFLDRNGYAWMRTMEHQLQLYQAMLAIAAHTLDKGGLAALLRELWDSAH